MLTNNDLNLSSKRSSFFVVGIGGAGMSAIAKVLLGLGHQVAGSDAAESDMLDELRSLGAEVFVGHAAGNIGQAEVVTHSTAVPEDNPELVEARARDLPVMRRSQVLAAISRTKEALLIAGTHGKTTTTSMLAVLLSTLGKDPSFIVGGQIPALGGGAGVGEGDYFVIEADESDGTFLELDASGAVITNIEPDHLEYYGDFETLEAAFVDFAKGVDGPIALCLDDPGCKRLLHNLPADHKHKVVTFGFDDSAEWQILATEPNGVGQKVKVAYRDKIFESVLAQPGAHNATNALGAATLAIAKGLDTGQVFAKLGEFTGVGRRYELRGSTNGITLVDDYAHLPTEIEAAIAAASSTSPKRLVVIFQPHRYSRTEQLWESFGTSFVGADLLIVTGIYSSGEPKREGITGELIANAVRGQDHNTEVKYIETLAEVESFAINNLQAGDLCLTLGAGDLTESPSRILENLKARS